VAVSDLPAELIALTLNV
jgi:hypothetical protein